MKEILNRWNDSDKIKDDLVTYLKLNKIKAYYSEHCAMVYMMHLNCDCCRLRWNDMDIGCLDNDIFSMVK